MKQLRLAVAAFAFVVAPIAAAQDAPQDPPYLDNRSDAAELVRSLYNAISRREYARAWDYFGEQKPAKDFLMFSDGYADTARVDVETGSVSSEGAAGSIYYSVPVAIKAFDGDGNASTYAGCYTARLVNPQLQESPFKPLHLEKGTLKPAEGELAAVLPASCGDGPPPPQRDSILENVKKRFAADYSEICQTLDSGEPGAADPTETTIGFNYKHDGATDDQREARLFRFPCNMAAYNSREVYYLADDSGELRQLQFATPELDIRYENDDSEGKLESIGVIGYRATDQLVNSGYSPETKVIESFDKWRGVGDASTTGRWMFRDGQFTLVKYDVDATYDGEINPESVIDYETPP